MPRSSTLTKLAAIIAATLLLVMFLNGPQDLEEQSTARSRRSLSAKSPRHEVIEPLERNLSKQQSGYQPLFSGGHHPQRIATMAATSTTIMLLSYPRMWPNNFYLVGLRQAGFQVAVVGHPSDPPGRLA
jgi:hypothetical protein